MRTHVWSNSDVQMGLVSYAVEQQHNELLLYRDGDKLQLYVSGGHATLDNAPIWDGAWHVICSTWSSRDGAWQIYTDGVLRDSGAGLKKREVVRSGGTWILGQDQDSVGGDFEEDQAFSGELSQVNLWDHVLSPEEISTNWTVSCNHHGNVVDWTATYIGVFGMARRHQYDCGLQPGGLQKITFPAPPSDISYVWLNTTLSQPLTSFTLCLHMRTDIRSDRDMALVSYAVRQHHNELLLYRDGDKLQLFVSGDHTDSVNLPVWDGAWHVICSTWRSSDGAWQIYSDGVLRRSGAGLKKREVVRSGGTWILGQDQDSVGGGFEEDQAFSGELSQVNLWGHVLSPGKIGTNWTVSCNRHGNVIDWTATDIGVFGMVKRDQYYCAANNLSNIALRQPAIQSSTAYSGVASRAVDGNRYSGYSGASCTHTSHQANPWWRVDLGSIKRVDRVVVFNRQDCCSDRLESFQVHVGDNSNVVHNPTCGDAQSVAGRIVITVKCGLPGRYVGVTLPGTKTLTLCEVEVYGDNVVISTLSITDISSPATSRYTSLFEGRGYLNCALPCHVLPDTLTVLTDAVSTHSPRNVIASENVSLTLTARRPVDQTSLKDSIRQSLEEKADEICEAKCEIGEIFLPIFTDTTIARKKRQAGDKVQINVIIQLIVLASQGSNLDGQMAESLLLTNMPTKSGNEMTNLDTPKPRDHPATDGSVDNIIYNTEDEGVVDNVIYNTGDDGTVDNVIYEGQDSQTNDRENNMPDFFRYWTIPACVQPTMTTMMASMLLLLYVVNNGETSSDFEWCEVNSTARVCEHQTLSLRCPTGQYINIISALYGRILPSSVCSGPVRTTNCNSTNSLKVVTDSCNGRGNCSVTANNGVFGDPCGGTFKYLEVACSCTGRTTGQPTSTSSIKPEMTSNMVSLTFVHLPLIPPQLSLQILSRRIRLPLIAVIFHNITDTTPARKKRQADDEVTINVTIQLTVLVSQGGTLDRKMAEDLLQEKADNLRRLARSPGGLSINIGGKVVRLVDNSGEGQKTPPWLIGVICAAVVVIIIIALVTVLLCRRKHTPGVNMPGKSGNEMTNLDTSKRRDHPATDGSVDNIIYNTEDEGVVDNVIYNAGDDGTVDNVIYEGQDSQTKDREATSDMMMAASEDSNIENISQ
uniref:Uncharacterized protein n=1 Tax=Branchiostoma floridae TaxID=7739 RepID=C3XRH2_BRAFL|eukprot:XP_002613281.1 hypothetical protein BRAFLDRAFT_68246 [Branchiostoma floridae]